MKKTIKKRAFVSAIAMLIVSAIVLTSSTFAWFTMSKQASVETMNLTVSSPEGIQISANASAWTSSLTLDDIFNIDTSDEPGRYDAYEGNKNIWPADLIPCSSGLDGADSSGHNYFYRSSINDSGYATTGLVTQDASNPNSVGIIAFDLFFKVASAQTVMFGTSEFLDPAGTDILTALRVAFVPLGTVAVTTPTADIIALSAFPGASNCTMYEPDSINRSADALANDQPTGNRTTYHLRNTVNANVDANGVLPSSASAVATNARLLRSNAATMDKNFELSAGITKMRVLIWVEGQDIDCRNSVAGAAFTAALKFTIN